MNTKCIKKNNFVWNLTFGTAGTITACMFSSLICLKRLTTSLIWSILCKRHESIRSSCQLYESAPIQKFINGIRVPSPTNSLEFTFVKRRICKAQNNRSICFTTCFSPRFEPSDGGYRIELMSSSTFENQRWLCLTEIRSSSHSVRMRVKHDRII